jgi:hypothetical protein
MRKKERLCELEDRIGERKKLDWGEMIRASGTHGTIFKTNIHAIGVPMECQKESRKSVMLNKNT